MRRAHLVVAAVALVTVPTTQVLAQEATTTPAPPAEASGQAAQVGDLVGIGESEARADQETGSGAGNAITVNGEPTPASAGGSASGNEQKEGAVVDTGDTPLGRVRVAPWRARASSSTAARHGDGRSALLDVTVLDPNAVTLSVLQSESEADHTGLQSSSQASSDGAVLQVGGDEGLTVVVLHAEANSVGTGEAFLLGINDTELFTSEQAGGQCSIELPDLLRLICLQVTGGPGDIGAQVLDVTIGPDLVGADIVGADTTGGEGTAPAPQVLPGVTERPAPEQARAAGGLAATGAPSTLVAVGLALLLLGASVEALRRRQSALA